MNNEEKKAKAIEIKEKIQQDNAKMLDDLINEIEERMRARDLSDDYLEEHDCSTRKDIGIGEYAYGITMIPCEWIYVMMRDIKEQEKYGYGDKGDKNDWLRLFAILEKNV